MMETKRRSPRMGYDHRIYAMFKNGNLSNVDIANQLGVHVNTVANAIKRQQIKEQALKDCGEA